MKIKTHGCTKVNVVSPGLVLQPGKFYGVTWYSEGIFGFNEVCFIPPGTANPTKFFKRWLDEVMQLIEATPTIDIFIKEMEAV